MALVIFLQSFKDFRGFGEGNLRTKEAENNASRSRIDRRGKGGWGARQTVRKYQR